MIREPGAYPEIFRGRGSEKFLYGRENLGTFGIFFLKSSSKLKKNSQKGGHPLKPHMNTLLPRTCSLNIDFKNEEVNFKALLL